MSTEGAVLHWTPFRLTPSEYRKFLAYLRAVGERFEIVDFDTSDYSIWFTKCFSKEQRSNKQRAALAMRGKKTGKKALKHRRQRD